MIVQIASTVVPEPNLNAYLDAQTRELADYESAAGLVSVWLLRRQFVAYIEVMTVSLWESALALHQFTKSQVAEYRGGVDYGAVRMEARTYELATLREGKRRGVNVADPSSTE